MTGDLERSARLSVAPMMDWTDRHCRYFHRLLSRQALLHTEMIAAAALVRGRALHLLEHSPRERPVALQLGGCDPAELAEAARLGEEAGYSEINLNCGCPSDRVQSGDFGAALMRTPDIVGECVAAMREATNLEVTVKCRIGVDDQDPETALPAFLERVEAAGCRRVTIHARKAWLEGLSPKENREVPPLDHGLVLRMKERFPELRIVVNGGIASVPQVREMLEAGLDGVMVGRAAYREPARMLAAADRDVFGSDSDSVERPVDVARRMLPYIEEHLAAGGRLHQVTRHMLGLFAGRPGARAWRQALSVGAARKGSGPEVVEAAIAELPEANASASHFEAVPG